MVWLSSCVHSLEKGLTTELPPRCKIWVYICVVLRSAWPNWSCTVRMSAPDWSMWVAKEWRKVWGVTCFSIHALLAAKVTFRCTCFSLIWWRLSFWLSGSILNFAEGNKYCQFKLLLADGYFNCNAWGIQTPVHIRMDADHLFSLMLITVFS